VKKYLYVTVLLLLVLSVAAPAAVAKVNVDFAPDFDFESCGTVVWGEGTPAANELNERRIRSALVGQMETLGLTFVDAGRPADLVLLTHAFAERQTKTSNVSVGLGFSRRTKRGAVSVGGSTGGRTRVIKAGTLIIELLDGRTGDLVWQARASDTIEGGADKMEAKIRKAVQKAFRDFPPRN
jgi:hypothetical protein